LARGVSDEGNKPRAFALSAVSYREEPDSFSRHHERCQRLTAMPYDALGERTFMTGMTRGRPAGAARPAGAGAPTVRENLTTVGYWLSLGAAAGGLGGMAIGGVGGRIAMFVLRLTSDDSVRGIESDDGFTIGQFDAGDTSSLLFVTAVMGAIVGLFVGFGGVFLLVGPSEITGVEGSFDTFGVILLLFAPLFWSMGSIYAKGADMPRSTLLSTGMQMLTGALALFIVSVVKGELNGFNFGLVSMRSWLGLVYLITFGSLIGFVSYGWLLHNAPVSLMSTYAYVNPVVAVLLGNLLADEPLNGRILIATAIIIGSVIFINSARQVKVKTQPLQAVPDGDD